MHTCYHHSTYSMSHTCITHPIHSSHSLFSPLLHPPFLSSSPSAPPPSYDFYQNKKETHIGSRSDRFLKLLELQVRATL